MVQETKNTTLEEIIAEMDKTFEEENEEEESYKKLLLKDKMQANKKSIHTKPKKDTKRNIVIKNIKNMTVAQAQVYSAY